MSAYREQPVAGPLREWVECCWSLETHAAIPGHRVVPDGCIDIVYRRGRGIQAVGAMRREQRFDLGPGAFMVGVRFHPGMAAGVLGLSAAELTDDACDLAHVWPRRAPELAARLDEARSIEQISRYLLRAVHPNSERPDPVQRAIAYISENRGKVELSDVAHQAGLSIRQFRRRCLEASGLSPKLLARILRFRHAYTTACSADRPEWARIAAETAYFDQAHLIRDFHEFCGASPMAVFSKRAEAHSPYA